MEVELKEHQVPPKDTWNKWKLTGGRGSGKTYAVSYYMNNYMKDNDNSIGLMITPILNDLWESFDLMKGFNSEIKIQVIKGHLCAYWPNDSVVYFFGAVDKKDIDRVKSLKPNLLCCENIDNWDLRKEMFKVIDRYSDCKVIITTHELDENSPRTPYIEQTSFLAEIYG